MPSSRRAAALIGGLTLITGGLAVVATTTAVANPGGTDLIISEVYGGGGNAGATHRNDFVELHNPTSEPLSANGLTISYYSSAGNLGGSHTLDCGVVPPGGHFLIQEAAGANADGTAAPLPAPDAFGELAMSGTNGSIEVTRGGAVVDLVGYGTATRREGTAAQALTNSTAASRTVTRQQPDTDDNSVDFARGTPVPQNDGVDAVCEPDVEEPPVAEEVTIAEIQGDGAASPMAGDRVNVEAVVTSVITANDVTDGFFLQEEDADADADPATSEGIYVFCGSNCPEDLTAGDRYGVVGTVTEFFAMTQIDATGDGSLEFLESGSALPTAAVVGLPAAASTEDSATFEHVEGMRTTISTTLAVSEYFNQARFGEIVLTANERPYQFTQTDEPTVGGYDAFLEDLSTRQIILDDDSNSQNAAITGPDDNEAYYYPTPGLSAGNFFRGGDTINNLTGVFEYAFGAWKLRPVSGEDYTFDAANPRPDSAPAVGGRLTVASFNVLNYFATIDETSSDGSGPCGPVGGQDCRGADSEAERVRQLDKIVAALEKIDADVFGLIEIQNDEGEATGQIVDALNAATAPGTYDFIDTGYIGTDAIKQAFVYNTTTVEPVGDYDLLTSEDDSRFDDERNRPALIQTFEESSTGERVTVAVNHLKSKGSDCSQSGIPGDDSPEDGSGNCDGTRTAAAEALAEHLADDPTGTGESDTLIIGDLNSYAMERPIAALLDAGYTDLLQEFQGSDAYTYLFDGQLGTLDYGLANDSLADQVTGAAGWAINADENPLFDYNDTIRDSGEASFERKSTEGTLYEPTAYRASDHDPVIIGLDLGDAPEGEEVEMDIRLKPGKVEAGKTRPRLEVEVEDSIDRRQPVSGVIRVSFEDEVRTETLRKGKALFELGTFDTPGVVTVTVEYLGDDTHAPRTETFTFEVRSKKG